MNDTITTRDHTEIEDWITEHGGTPSKVPETFAELRVDFEEGEKLEEISWDEFFEVLESEGLAMEYEEEPEKDTRPPSKKYDFIEEEPAVPDEPKSEMDEEEIKANMEETSE
ncbi:MAG: hypothetical protein ACLFTA_02350 [Candidatus Nanohaloarchaea archaeon]